jgi:hypothetical protein
MLVVGIDVGVVENLVIEKRSKSMAHENIMAEQPADRGAQDVQYTQFARDYRRGGRQFHEIMPGAVACQRRRSRITIVSPGRTAAVIGTEAV